MTSIDIIDEVQQNFVDGSYDTNANRAFPDVRDGLKPGQRCVLWEMYTKKYTSNKPHVKSAKIDGGVAALWWPHGTTAIYETFARMSQPFTNNVPEIDFHGANGNVILGGDAIAADRYCLTGEAKIITSYGTMPIQSVQRYTEKDGETLPEDFFIQDYKGDFVHADKLFNSGVHPVKEVSLQNGQSITGTDNHPVVVLSGGGLGWKRIDQLSTFDKVAVPTFAPKMEIKTNKNSGPLEAKMLGSMISEGCITTQNRLGVTNQDIDMVTPVKNFLQSQGVGLQASIKYRESDKTYNFYVSSHDYYSSFIKKYNYKHRADKKVVPSIVFCEDEQYKSTFLRYLFEGDGCVLLNEKKQEARVSYSTYSVQLAKDVQILLLSLGIFCSINKSVKKTKSKAEYQVHIRGYDIILFKKYVNFVSDRKRDKLHKCVQIQNAKNKISNNSYRYCPEISNLIQRKMPRDKQTTGFGDLYSIWKAQPYLDNYTFSRVQAILTDYVFVPIASIEKKQEKAVYSVRVMEPDSDHSYIANGIINHNTEARLSKIVEDYMIAGIEKKTVPMQLNFSEDEYMPTVLPSVFPRLLVNGAQGIGVSVANTWLPHNLTDTINLIGKYIKNGKLEYEEYYPDFPTGGTIINKDELAAINKTGKGRVILQAKYSIDKNEITFTEMPYQVYIEPVIEKIKEQIEKGELTGIKEVFNKSDKKKIALVIECAKDENPEVVVERLFQQTPLRSQYNANQNGIISKTPVLLNLQQTIDVYVRHNLLCIQKEHEYDLSAANGRIEILEGLIKALVDIDDIVFIIRNAENATDAKKSLKEKYNFTDNQAKAILDMRLAKLTKLDGVALNEELKEKKNLAAFCDEVINSEDKRKEIFLNRLREMGKKNKQDRRTEVIQMDIVKEKKPGEKKQEVSEPCIITFNPLGYLQRIPVTQYRSSKFHNFKTTTTDLIMLFSNAGKFYRISAKDIKSCGTKDKGTAIGSIVSLDNNEKILAVYPNEVNESKPYVLFATKDGKVKKTETIQYVGETRNLKGMVATKTECGIIGIEYTNGNDIALRTNGGYCIRFDAESVRASGKNSSGVKGITLQDGDFVVECKVIEKDTKTKTPVQNRGGKGKKVC